MNWKLWLDDQMLDNEAPDRHCPEGFFGARSTGEAQRLCLMAGPPSFVDFDHDLGGSDDALVFLHWLEKSFPDTPPEYQIHSANPVGRERIVSFLESWKKSLQL